MTFRERREEQRVRNARITVKQYRCRYCRVVVDSVSREGHLGRCTELVRAGATFSRGAPVDEHFEEVARR